MMRPFDVAKTGRAIEGHACMAIRGVDIQLDQDAAAAGAAGQSRSLATWASVTVEALRLREAARWRTTSAMPR